MEYGVAHVVRSLPNRPRSIQRSAMLVFDRAVQLHQCARFLHSNELLDILLNIYLPGCELQVHGRLENKAKHTLHHAP